jgi:hypothetical protein
MENSNRTQKTFRRLGAGMILAAGVSVHALAGELTFGGEVSIEGRWFPDAPAFAKQLETEQMSVALTPEIEWESEDRSHKLSFTGFYRKDGGDEERSHGDIREAYYRYTNGEWEVLAGVNRVFWGVTESRHLVNIINQVDGVEDVDAEDFLGQTMVQIARQTDMGRFELFLLPGFRDRTFPGIEGRLRTGLPVDSNAVTYESGDGKDHVDVALRYSHYFGDFDLGLHVFHGTSREPTLIPNLAGEALTPHYPIITQAGIDFQYTNEAWLWKLEAIARKGQGETFGAAVAGFEYTMYQISGTDMDLGLLAEVSYDGRDATAFPTIYDQDLFLGGRLAFNDAADTSILAGLLTDKDTGPTALRIEAERRLGENWSVEVVGQVFLQDDASDPATQFEQDSHVSLTLTRHF